MDKQNVVFRTMKYHSEIKRNDLLIHKTTSINLKIILLSERRQKKKKKEGKEKKKAHTV